MASDSSAPYTCIQHVRPSSSPVQSGVAPKLFELLQIVLPPPIVRSTENSNETQASKKHKVKEKKPKVSVERRLELLNRKVEKASVPPLKEEWVRGILKVQMYHPHCIQLSKF